MGPPLHDWFRRMASGWTLYFMIRCSAAPVTAYELATLFALPEAVWAAMSAVIVSQDRLCDTISSFARRVVGTPIGIGVTVAVSAIASRAPAGAAPQMASRWRSARLSPTAFRSFGWRCGPA